MRRLVAVFAVLAVCGLAFAMLGPVPDRDDPRPDVILVTVDTLRADRLGAYGWERANTPTIDALAARGLRFTDATTPLPRTTPGLASLHTGLWPHHHGSREVMRPMERGTTLAEVLQEAGWETIAVSSQRGASPELGFARGFDDFVQQEEIGSKEAGAVTRHALDALDAADPAAPLFAWVHYYDPHWPYQPPEHGGEAPRCDALASKAQKRKLTRGQIFSDLRGLATAALEDCSTRYDAEIAYTDREIGRLLDGLEALGRLRNAIVVLTADHGENLGEDRLFFQHGPSVHDGSLLVPMIVAGPGLRAGAVDEQPFRLEDVAPTLLALLGLQAPPTDGLDLSWRLRDGGTPPEGYSEPVALVEAGGALLIDYWPALVSGRESTGWCLNDARFSLCFDARDRRRLFDRSVDPRRKKNVARAHPEEVARLEAARARWKPEAARARAIRTPEWKLVQRPLLEGGFETALYALAEGEERDVSAEHPEVAARLQAQLEAWSAGLPEYATPERGADELEALEALGYIEAHED